MTSRTSRPSTPCSCVRISCRLSAACARARATFGRSASEASWAMVAMARTASISSATGATGDARADACAAGETARSTGGSSSASAAVSEGADGFALRAVRTMTPNARGVTEAVGRTGSRFRSQNVPFLSRHRHCSLNVHWCAFSTYDFRAKLTLTKRATFTRAFSRQRRRLARRVPHEATHTRAPRP